MKKSKIIKLLYNIFQFKSLCTRLPNRKYRARFISRSLDIEFLFTIKFHFEKLRSQEVLVTESVNASTILMCLNMFNFSFQHDIFPNAFKSTNPEKTGLMTESSLQTMYRPVSNPPALGKLLERLADSRLI